MARALGIPLVVGIETKLEEPIQTGDLMIIDGDKGVVLLDPEDDLIDRYSQLQLQYQEATVRLKRIVSVTVGNEGRQRNRARRQYQLVERA